MSLKSKWQKFCLNNQKKITVFLIVALIPYFIILFVVRFFQLFFLSILCIMVGDWDWYKIKAEWVDFFIIY